MYPKNLRNRLFKVAMLLALFAKSQELILNDGVYMEKPLKNDTTKHKYSLDNISYKVNSVFVFDYYYLDKDGKKKKFLHSKNENSRENPLNLADYDDKSEEVIGKVKMEVDDLWDFVAMGDADYTQTVFSYVYLKPDGKSRDTICDVFRRKGKKIDFPCGEESTGIVDNKKNLWMHPPREYTFRILQLSPFPFYYLDETVMNWSTTMEAGGFYLDPRWIDQRENITLNFQYKRLPDETIVTPLGKMKCKVSEGNGTARLKSGALNTGLKSYYVRQFGFVRLEYLNVNGSKLVMELVEAH